MAQTDPTDATTSDAPSPRAPQWRLRYQVGDLVHYTEWTSEFAAVENLAEQYRREAYGHDVVIEHRNWWTLHAWLHFDNPEGLFASFNHDSEWDSLSAPPHH
ncbi:hypothetical protein [Haloarcula sp. JP-L23]|uniref:hypothetical protein n=1 Tax=Haloarcula sp. JP-L23 TaxID=2716717 RepID=UPI0032E44AAF